MQGEAFYTKQRKIWIIDSKSQTQYKKGLIPGFLQVPCHRRGPRGLISTRNFRRNRAISKEAIIES
jgi:hypothetical protein